MHIQEITEKDREEYNAFVANNNGSFLQSFEWGEWQEKNGRKAKRYLVADEAGTTQIAAQFLLYPLPLGQFYLYCPYGPVINFQFPISPPKADPPGAGNFQNAIQKLVEQIKKDYPRALFLKFELTASLELSTQGGPAWGGQPSSRIQPGSTLLLDLSKTEEQLQMEMHQKTRYNIKVANKHGVIVKTGTDLAGPEAEEILSLITKTTERQAYKGHSFSYYKNFCSFFATGLQRKDNVNEVSNTSTANVKVRWYAAFYQDTLLSGGIFVDFGGTRTYLYGGSNDAQKNIMAPYALHWHAIRDAKQQGLNSYDFGGLETSSGATPGFARFKIGFGGEQTSYPPPQDISWNKIAYRAYRLAKQVLK